MKSSKIAFILHLLIIILILSSCEKINIFKKRNQFILDDEKYKIDDYKATFFGPTLTRYLFESGDNLVDLELSYGTKNGLDCREYIYDANDFDYRMVFHKYNGAIKKCRSGKINISEIKPNEYEMNFEATMSGGLALTGYFRDKFQAENKENSFLYNNSYYSIDTVLVFRRDENYGHFYEVYLFNDFEDYNAPLLGFLMFAYSHDELNDVVRDIYNDFIAIVVLNGDEVYEVSNGKYKSTYISKTDDDILTYDFYFSLVFNREETVLGDYVGDFIIQPMGKSTKIKDKIRKCFQAESIFDKLIKK